MICLDAMTYDEAAMAIGITESHVGVLLNLSTRGPQRTIAFVCTRDNK